TRAVARAAEAVLNLRPGFAPHAPCYVGDVKRALGHWPCPRCDQRVTVYEEYRRNPGGAGRDRRRRCVSGRCPCGWGDGRAWHTGCPNCGKPLTLAEEYHRAPTHHCARCDFDNVSSTCSLCNTPLDGASPGEDSVRWQVSGRCGCGLELEADVPFPYPRTDRP